MRLLAQCHLRYQVAEPAAAIAKVHVRREAGQTITNEALELTSGAHLEIVPDPASGARWLTGTVAGEFEIAYRAVVDVLPRAPLPSDARQHDWTQLDSEALTYLLPSRFCPSDKFGRFVEREFRHTAPGGERVNAILDWLHAKIDYLHGVSDAETTAERTFVDRAGVCRDFTHLGITLCRASGIPARAVAAYALALEPADFHAVMEVYVGGGWWLIDPTRLAPTDGLIRIVHGRDAADIAFLTTAGAAVPVAVTVSVAELRGTAVTAPLPPSREGSSQDGGAPTPAPVSVRAPP